MNWLKLWEQQHREVTGAGFVQSNCSRSTLKTGIFRGLFILMGTLKPRAKLPAPHLALFRFLVFPRMSISLFTASWGAPVGKNHPAK